jgi:hypothetical protein
VLPGGNVSTVALMGRGRIQVEEACSMNREEELWWMGVGCTPYLTAWAEARWGGTSGGTSGGTVQAQWRHSREEEEAQWRETTEIRGLTKANQNGSGLECWNVC